MPARNLLARWNARYFRRLRWRRLAAAALVILAAYFVLRFVGRLLWSTAYLATFATVAAATWWIVWPDLRSLVGWENPRPWLVRFREHQWRPVATPFGRPAPRSLAYGLLAIAWWWLLG